MKELQIYYFSGTGNAKNVANWTAEKAKEHNFIVTVNDLSKIDRKSISVPKKEAMIGFVSPTHGFNFPPVMLHFLFDFPKTKFRNPVFVVNTRAGMKMGKIFVPGLSGLALWFATIILWLKGYQINGLHSIDLPSNWISIHPGIKEKVITSIFERGKAITFSFTENLCNGKKTYRALRDIPQDLIIAPVSIAYYFIGRYVFSKSFFANSTCNNCNICVNNCPVKAIKIVGKNPFWTLKCESCMRCMNECPKRAIETGHGYIIGILYLAGLFSGMFFWPVVNRNFDQLNLIGLKFIKPVIDSLFAILLLVAGYRIIHYLRRIVVAKQLIEYSLLTRYKFWRRYKNRRR